MTDLTDGVLHTLFHSDQGGHEQVVLCQDRASGLKAVIAIHSTALGPALGGTRFYPYASEEEAVADALNLSRGMSYKNAMAGLDHGGGKAVIIGDPEQIKSEALLLAYGRFVASLGGRYVTACDVGTYVSDMDVVARECRWTTGRSPENGGAGDSSVLTAYGVFQGMRASAQHLWGDPTLRGRKVGIAGVGKVGHHLVDHLREDGAEVVITDVRDESVRRILDKHPTGVTAATDTEALIRGDHPSGGLDIYAPCALGGALNDASVPVLTARIVCGAANNQLAHPGVEKDLADRGILYAPDYVVNAGGVIQVADELHGFDFDRCKAKATKIFDTTLDIFARAKEDGIPPAAAADRIAEQRMAEARRRG
ncbi:MULTISPECIES: Leu/Phe/Val dehydrogenase [Streptomyces]|uniref:Valine dehydrogenase n=1 Tax=Streptomyces mirabilis TaxID=68239 RepID=A0ABU3UQP9_9ACTN|nr:MULTISPECIES: Glu/Leu/Phe/Val dehydrogenase dimerization domain-containing protein [Streptomyces]KPI04033.1 Leucine dehydrogenase [Actinobacteria bacterium OK006]MCX4610093.1 Glu/Leu/Phe/Val dehydrogenase [Streptomyces mirabilis]MCX5350330.1 Glu/Leu/Phe/Val dehydrogenase [Streptomyces mirabilis]MDU8996254.1 Glu/Leu/Phe/Val dehydrogenase dimerization domain-containing protein [Streptomyces mirabilis]NMI59381.1 Glu/Leu/Phe/Val dehydrogenase [Streptomyces sp. RLA2-12]